MRSLLYLLASIQLWKIRSSTTWASLKHCKYLTRAHTHTHTTHCLTHYVVPYLYCQPYSDSPFVWFTKRGQSLFLLCCCLIERTDSFPPLITSRQAGGGKSWDMVTFALHRQPIMGVNWNSWVEMFAGSAQRGDCFQEALNPTFLPFILAFKTLLL